MKISKMEDGEHFEFSELERDISDHVFTMDRAVRRLDGSGNGPSFYEGSLDGNVRKEREANYEAVSLPNDDCYGTVQLGGDVTNAEIGCDYWFSPSIWSESYEGGVRSSGYHRCIRSDIAWEPCDVPERPLCPDNAAREESVHVSSLLSDEGDGSAQRERHGVEDNWRELGAGGDAWDSRTRRSDRGVREDIDANRLGSGGGAGRRERVGDDELGRGRSVCDGGGADGTTSEATAELNAKSFLLTYAQCSINKKDLFDYLERKGALERLIVCEERHADGSPHLHAFVTYKNKKSHCSMRYFDFHGYHPNIRIHKKGCDPKVSAENCWNYCLKADPAPLIYGDRPEKKKRKREATFRNALELSQRTGVRSAMDVLLAECAYETMIHYEQIERALLAERRKHSKHTTAARPLSDFEFAPKNLPPLETLFMYGATDLGKTAYARAMLPEAALIRHVDQLKGVDFSKGLIFDDFAVSHWPVTSIIHLLDWDEESGINVKHSHVIIPPHTKKIFTSNCSFERWLPETISDEHLQACRRRVHVVHINTRLF